MSSSLSLSFSPGRTLQFIISIIVYRITVFYVVPVTRIDEHKVPRGGLGRDPESTNSIKPGRTYLRARRYDFYFIALAWAITKKSNYFRRARALVRASFPVNIFSTPQKASLACPSSPNWILGGWFTKLLKTLFVVYTTASNHEFATEFKWQLRVNFQRCIS